jgi:predicted patatin/cPLA2 family phospholipase
MNDSGITETGSHPVLELVAARHADAGRPGARGDEARLALVIEGGGMRGAITGGMILALEELGLGDVFDGVYGASAGALNAAWLVSGAAAVGMPGWSDPAIRMATVRRRNLLRGRLIDGAHLTDVVYEELTPMPFARVLANPVTLHPTATDAHTGEAADLAALITDTRTLKLALRASTALPLLSGPPVRLGGRRWFDAGLAEAVPFRTAMAQGATHILVLRSRRQGEQETSEGGRTGRFVARYLARHSHELAAAFLDRPARLLRDDAELDERERDLTATPLLLSIRPAADTPAIGRIERDHERVLAGLRAGHEAARACLTPALQLREAGGPGHSGRPHLNRRRNR